MFQTNMLNFLGRMKISHLRSSRNVAETPSHQRKHFLECQAQRRLGSHRSSQGNATDGVLLAMFQRMGGEKVPVACAKSYLQAKSKHGQLPPRL